MSGDSKSENGAKVEEQVRVVVEGSDYQAVLWIGDRYVSGSGKSEDEARARLCMTIYELVGEGCPINPLNLPAAVRKAVLEYGGKMADIVRSELIKKTAAYLRFAPHIGYQPELGDPTTYVCSPLEVAARCIHRGADLADTDPAYMPEVLVWFYAEINALEHSADCAKRKGFTEGAASAMAKAEALKAQLTSNGFGWAGKLGWVTATDDR